MERFGPEAFNGTRLRRAGAWAVDFSAEWCPYCEMFLPVFASLRGSGPFELAIGDLTDLETPLWETFELSITPTVIGFRDGRSVFRADGRPNIGLNANDMRGLVAALRAGEPSESGEGGDRS